MHTALAIAAGLVLLGLFLAIGRWRAGSTHGVAHAAVLFVPVWCALAAINMWVGVSRAGYPVAAEAPIFVVVFGVPALAAVFVRWTRLRHAR